MLAPRRRFSANNEIPEGAHNLFPEIVRSRHTTATNIGGVTRNSALIVPHELIVMRIMNGTSDDAAGFPAEGDLASCAPHLIATADLENTLAARWARFGVFLEKLDGFDGIFVTYMVFALYLAALGANIRIAYLAFPTRGKKALAIGNGARLGKFIIDFLFGPVAHYVLIAPDLVVNVRDLLPQFSFLSKKYRIFFFQFFVFNESFNRGHRGRDPTLFDTEQEFFPTVLIFLVHKGFG